MKEVALTKQYIDILNIAKESPDAQKLLQYRAPHAAKQVRPGYVMWETCISKRTRQENLSQFKISPFLLIVATWPAGFSQKVFRPSFV